MAFEFNTLAQAAAARIVDCLIGGMLIAMFAAAVAWIARRQDSKARFAVWMAALMMIPVLPLIAELRSYPAASAGFMPRAAFTLSSEWAVYIVAAWAALASVGLIRIAVGLIRIRGLRERCETINPETLDSQMRETIARSSAKAVAVCISDELNVPAAIGLMRPAVVFPRWAFEEMSAAELNQILLHELAHLERRDDWTNLAQKIVKAVFFFHPAVWWIERQISLEREMACDDVVLEKIESPRSYAECLAHLAEKSFVQRSIAMAQAALGHIRQTTQRVARILEAKGSSGNKAGWKMAVPAVAVFAVASSVGISRAPQLVTFSARPSNVPASMIAGDIDNMHVPVIQAKLNDVMPARQHVVSIPPNEKHPARKVNPTPVPENDRLIHFASIQAAPVGLTQAVFVVFEEQQISQTDQGFYSIRVWRLTVYHPAADQAEHKIPRKET